MMKAVRVIGGGLAGTECALYLASHGISVELVDMKPVKKSPAHKSDGFAELVCSNSLKSNDVFGNACGLLKEEMRLLGSAVIAVADRTRVPAGNALAVNRDAFSAELTRLIKDNQLISVKSEEVKDLSYDGITVVATGPLTSEPLLEEIAKLTGKQPFFFDAAAPIVSADSIDMDHAFFGDRYGKGNGDHLNCPMTKDEYTAFYDALIRAERAPQKEFENDAVFEGCMPVEVMAARGVDTLRFGPLKPAGLDDPKTGRWPYACLQLRREDEAGTMYNLVGFQTNLLFPEQRRVFGMIPALKNAEYYRYGVMHKNTYIPAPEILDSDFSVKGNGNLFFAGQIAGVEGYVESAAAGLLVAIHIERRLHGKEPVRFGTETVLGALSKHVSTPSPDFEPMNANFGILDDYVLPKKDKALKKRKQAERSLESVRAIAERLKEN